MTLDALVQLLPEVLRAQRAELLAEVRAVVREELAREAGAQRAREVLALPERLTIDQAAELLGRSASYLRKHLQEPALGACLIPSGRRRGRGADLHFDRDKVLALGAGAPR